MANVKIKHLAKNQAWHDANASWVVDVGRIAILTGSNPLLFKIGDGSTALENLAWQNLTISTLEQILANGRSTGNFKIESPDQSTFLELINEEMSIGADDGNGNEGRLYIDFLKALLTHSAEIYIDSPSVKKNGYEIATENFVDNRVQSNIKIIGDWDAASGSFPLADESNTTPFITQWGSVIKAGWAFRVGYNQSGTVDGFEYENGDVVYALIDNPTDDANDWGDLDHNLQQATESLRGTAKIVANSIIDNEGTTDDERIVTSKKFWRGIARVTGLAWTWSLLQTFTSGIKTHLFTNDDGEFRFAKTVAGSVLIWTNGQNLKLAARVGGSPQIEIDKTTGKVILHEEGASKLLKTDATKGITSLSVSEDSIIKDSFDVAFDGQGGVIVVSANAIKRALPYAGTVTSFSIKGDAVGDVEIDMKKNGTSMIGGGTKLDLISQSSDSGTISGWTSTTWAVDDELEWSVISSTGISKLWLTVKFDKTS